jgi:hypothetical protein
VECGLRQLRSLRDEIDGRKTMKLLLAAVVLGRRAAVSRFGRNRPAHPVVGISATPDRQMLENGEIRGRGFVGVQGRRVRSRRCEGRCFGNIKKYTDLQLDVPDKSENCCQDLNGLSHWLTSNPASKRPFRLGAGGALRWPPGFTTPVRYMEFPRSEPVTRYNFPQLSCGSPCSLSRKAIHSHISLR